MLLRWWAAVFHEITSVAIDSVLAVVRLSLERLKDPLAQIRERANEGPKCTGQLSKVG